MPRRRLKFNAFTMNCVSHIHHGQWVRPDTRQREYNSLEPWLELAQLLERGKFDAVFLADVVGTYASYRGGRDIAVREGLQTPVNDPSLLIPAMATVTSDIGFAFTHSVLQEQPFNFARRVSTLDHLTGGRVGWNIVTSYLSDAGRNLGFGGLPEHDERYARAEEYVEVLYKLWEGSWEDDAVVADLENGVYSDPSKIHDIDHSGPFYPDVVGPHLSEPSPQRTPVLFQAGASERGREFAARNAEAIFIAARNPLGARAQVDDTRARAESWGRRGFDIQFFQGMSVITGGTEEEARRKEREIEEFASDEGYAAHMAGNLGIDLAEIDIEAPLADLEQANVQGILRGMIEAAPDKQWRFGDLLRWIADLRLVGAPEQVADGLEEWADAGVDGINLMYHVTPGSFVDFVDGVAPVLQERGLMQREYRPGTFREKLTDGEAGPLLDPRHPGAAVRRERLAGAAA
jgi:FMN-dependent oxidoreductase (nitrilotriacetate monooxygenase family)